MQARQDHRTLQVTNLRFLTYICCSGIARTDEHDGIACHRNGFGYASRTVDRVNLGIGQNEVGRTLIARLTTRAEKADKNQYSKAAFHFLFS
jgi:hypothetical protein